MERSKIQCEIDKARRLFADRGEAVSADERVIVLLDRYRAAIEKTSEAMRASGVSALCAKCALEGAGSCCFEGLEDGYDYVLLLVNMLLGCDVPDRRELPESCLFVGPRGCKLVGKFNFCLNYLCPDIRNALGALECGRLLRIVGEELSVGWELENTVRFLIGEVPDSAPPH